VAAALGGRSRWPSRLRRSRRRGWSPSGRSSGRDSSSPFLQRCAVMGPILRFQRLSCHLFSQFKPCSCGEPTDSSLWMISGPKSHPRTPQRQPSPAKNPSAPHPGRRPDSQRNLFSTGAGVKAMYRACRDDREAAGEAGARRASFTPGPVDKTLKTGSAAPPTKKHSTQRTRPTTHVRPKAPDQPQNPSYRPRT
jgi:hypothetical protein